MSWLPKDWIAKDNIKNKKKDKPKKADFEIKHRTTTELNSDKMRWKYHCPNLCQQKPNGSKGKKTFDGKICKACNYEKKA